MLRSIVGHTGVLNWTCTGKNQKGTSSKASAKACRLVKDLRFFFNTFYPDRKLLFNMC